MNHAARIARVAAVLGLVGPHLACADAVRARGTVDGRAVRAVGTVAAWVDRTAYAADEAGVPELVERPSSSTTLHLQFFEPVFDPTVSFAELSFAERLALEDAIARGDSIAVRVGRGAALRDGDRVEPPGSDGVPEVLPYLLETTVALRGEGDGATNYPDRLPLAAVSADRALLDVRTVQPRLEGTLALTFGEDDVVIDFAATLIAERTGECSFARLDAGILDACSLAPVAEEP
jgi:hypothetical protein